MKIEISKIKDTAGLEENISAKKWDLDSSDVTFVDNINVKCEFERIGEEVIVDTKVISNREITCSRCLNKVLKTIKQDFKKSYNVKDSGEFLDMDNDIREEILLNYPMKVLCKPDCKGICYGCGINLNLESCQCRSKSNIKV